jgi:glutamine amidotransferase
VPGVGHFAATASLAGAWTDGILARVGEGRPLLGICLGMQWLYESSDEAPDVAGLGVFGGRIVRLDPRPCGANDGTSANLKVPHVGWNSLALGRDAAIVDGIGAGAQVYFAHSYCAPITADTVATTTHGRAFTAAVQRGPVAGVQFHPEKSGVFGLQVLRNFCDQAR